MATAIGRPSAEVDVPLVGTIGVPGLENSATANALPFGVAIANSANALFAAPSDAAERHASATALGGIAAAYSALDTTEGAVCTALYATASLKDKDGGNVTSCTSIFFIFQQSQQGDDPVVYAIKNPFDINLVSPYGDGFADLISAGLGLLPGLAGIEIPDEVLDLIAGKFVPEFGSDIIRISFDGGTPQIGTDLPEWIAGLLDSNNTNALLSTSGTQVQNQADDEPTVVAASVDDSVEAAPLQVNEPAPIADTVVEDPAPLPELTFNEPKVEEPAIEAPVTEEPTVEAPAASEAEETGPAQEAPALDGIGAESAEDADSDADLVLN